METQGGLKGDGGEGVRNFGVGEILETAVGDLKRLGTLIDEKGPREKIRHLPVLVLVPKALVQLDKQGCGAPVPGPQDTPQPLEHLALEVR